MAAYEDVGNLFRVAREDACLSQQALAERASVGVSTVSRLELGVSVPRATNLAKLAHVLGVPPERLETTGLDAAADILRASLTSARRDMSAAYKALVGAEIELTRLGFEVVLSAPSEGVLLLRCETRDTAAEDESQTALPLIGRRARLRVVASAARTVPAATALVPASPIIVTSLIVTTTTAAAAVPRDGCQ